MLREGTGFKKKKNIQQEVAVPSFLSLKALFGLVFNAALPSPAPLQWLKQAKNQTLLHSPQANYVQGYGMLIKIIFSFKTSELFSSIKKKGKCINVPWMFLENYEKSTRTGKLDIAVIQNLGQKVNKQLLNNKAQTAKEEMCYFESCIYTCTHIHRRLQELF